MTGTPGTRVIPYRGFSTYSKVPIEGVSIENLLSKVEEEREDGLVRITIGEREVASLRIDNRRIYINEIVDCTPTEVESLRKYPVYYVTALKSLMEKYIDTVSGDAIEDLNFLDSIKKNPEIRKADGQKFILLLWDRYWDVRSRFNGDSYDGIYIIGERDVWDEKDRNTFNL
ncbi:MAG: hypothetical protein QXS30_01375 [Thermoplasmatales archaeon]